MACVHEQSRCDGSFFGSCFPRDSKPVDASCSGERRIMVMPLRACTHRFVPDALAVATVLELITSDLSPNFENSTS